MKKFNELLQDASRLASEYKALSPDEKESEAGMQLRNELTKTTKILNQTAMNEPYRSSPVGNYNVSTDELKRISMSTALIFSIQWLINRAFNFLRKK
ncbi:hypothetical protein [Adhaeribacter aquaticus]|uniref:hypothetical protein n=1 Tax=Adhaeribacter aquaticus TaxID=299567 RepID=UPI00047B4869|nr:hypothetical protein [Adhaeribacter aquaticus]